MVFDTWAPEGGAAFCLPGMLAVSAHRVRRAAITWLVLAARPCVAWAHTGRAPEPHDLWASWTFAPAVIVGLGLGAWCYARGVRRVWHAAGKGRGVPPWRVACFAGGILAVALALLSPIDSVATALFAVLIWSLRRTSMKRVKLCMTRRPAFSLRT